MGPTTYGGAHRFNNGKPTDLHVEHRRPSAGDAHGGLLKPERRA